TAGSGGPADLHFATAGMLLALGTVLEAPPVFHFDIVTGLPASLEFNKMVRWLPRRYALACVAIDEFRMFREEQGVEVANRMLRLVAKALTKIGGGGHVFYLLRDHEFVVVFPRQSMEAGARLSSSTGTSFAIMDRWQLTRLLRPRRPQMRKTFVAITALALVPLGAAGCVSKSEYTKTVQAAEARYNALDAENARLKRELADAAKRNEQLTADLTLKSGELGKSIADLRQR